MPRKKKMTNRSGQPKRRAAKTGTGSKPREAPGRKRVAEARDTAASVARQGESPPSFWRFG